MKKTARRLFCLLGAMLVLSCFSQRLHAKARDMDDAQPSLDNGAAANTELDPGEEARKIRRLAKMALQPAATEEVKKSLSDEIAAVEKNEKLKKEVVKHLLRDEDPDPDPTLPKVVQATYRDGTIRGVVFIQADAGHTAKPAELAWVIDSKREKKERGER